MFKRLLPFVAWLAFLLAACGIPAQNPATETPANIANPAATATSQVVATAPVVDQPTSGWVSCTLVSSLPDTPDAYAQLFAVRDGDWVLGPDDAAVTIIEYSDFQ